MEGAMERPAGVTIIALLEFLIAALLIFFALASAMGVSMLGAILSRTEKSALPVLPGSPERDWYWRSSCWCLRCFL